MKSFARGVLCAVVASFSFSAPALAASHSWRVYELFSNADRTVQYIELRECCGNPTENGLGSKQVTSNASTYTIPSGVAGNTAGKHYLLATAAFAALPGAPTPDRIISSLFFATGGDTIKYAPNFNYDTVVFGAGVLPTDGIHALRIDNGHVFSTVVNAPINYADQPGSVNAACNDADSDGYGNPGDASCPNGAATDCNNNNPAVHPGATELCADGIDNDCNGQADCADSACLTGPPCVPTLSTIGVAVAAGLLLLSGITVLKKRVVSAQN